MTNATVFDGGRKRVVRIADVFVEGKYVFPLPEGVAVDSLRMRVGDRWIQGMIAEREEAREIYEGAKGAGQVASLVEQLRPNAFTTSVANIAPGAEVIVQIEYQQSLAQAKAGLILALQRLDQDDLFNIVEFNSIYGSDELVLTTCWPINALISGPERLVIRAQPVSFAAPGLS